MLFFASGEGKKYVWKEDQALAKDLAEASTHVQCRDPSTWKELYLRPDGTTVSGFRYTQQGLDRLCQLLAPGLSKLVFDLCGAYRETGESTDLYSVCDAITIFNTTLQRRFDGRILDKYRTVVDLNRKVIDGFMPDRAALVTHRMFLRRVHEALARAKREMIMAEATVAGRRMTLRLVDRQAYFRDQRGRIWYRGIWLSNDELKSQEGLAGSGLLVDPKEPVFFLEPEIRYSSELSLAGHDDPELARFFDRLLAPAAWGTAFPNRFTKAHAQSIPIPLEGPERYQAITETAKKLQPYRLPDRIMKQALLGATMNADFSEDAPLAPAEAEIVVPTYFLLAKSLAKLAQSKHPELRERMERAACDLLTFRF